MNKLISSGYLYKSKFFSISGVNTYWVTRIGYDVILNESKQKYIPHLVLKDRQTKAHERYVAISRINLQKEGRVASWLSERELTMMIGDIKNLALREFLPDGIFIDQDNNKIAFELENARKSLPRLKEKIKNHLKFIDLNYFDRSLFVSTSNQVFKLINSCLSSEQPINSEIFTF